MLSRLESRDSVPADGSILSLLQSETDHPAVQALDVIEMKRLTDRGSIFFARAEQADWSVVIKFFSEGNAFAEAQRTFETHQAIHDALGTAGRLHVPEPLVVFSGLPAYAMRYAEGRSASELLASRSLFRAATRARVLSQAGRWLNQFHRKMGWTAAQVSIPFLTAGITKRRDAALSGSLHIPELEAFEDTVDILAETGADLGGFSFPKSLKHGDFSPPNLLLDDETVISLDFRNAGIQDIRPVSIDAANFLYYAEPIAGWERAERAGSPGGFRTDHLEAFSKAYPEMPWDSAELAWLFLLHVLERWSWLGHSANLESQKTDRAAMLKAMAAHAGDCLLARMS